MSLFQRMARVFTPRASHPAIDEAEARSRDVLNLIEGTAANGRPISRSVAATYFSVYRCAHLIASGIAELLQTATVMDRDGKTVKGYESNAVLKLLRESADGETPAWNFWADYAVDYCLEGNALLRIERLPSSMRPYRLDLLHSVGASILRDNVGFATHYRAQLVDLAPGRTEKIDVPIDDACHARWPRMQRAFGSHRTGFASAPITIIQGSIDTGLSLNEYVRGYFDPEDGALKSRVVIMFDDPADAEKQLTFIENLKAYRNSRYPLVLFGKGKVQTINETGQNKELSDLRRQTAAEVGAVYGVPAALIGDTTATQFAAEVEATARAFYKFGLKNHLNAVLGAISLRLLREGHRLRVDETSILRGDTAALTGLIGATAGNGQVPAILSVGELRGLIGVDPDNVPPSGLFKDSEGGNGDDNGDGNGDDNGDEGR